jgi:hypothetical protein
MKSPIRHADTPTDGLMIGAPIVPECATIEGWS